MNVNLALYQLVYNFHFFFISSYRYGEYNQLSGILHKYMKPAEKVLVIGCGNSRLSADLYDIGYHSITNIDISDTVITQMINQNRKKRPNMQFLKMDVTKV